MLAGMWFTSGGKERELIRWAAIHGSWKLGRELTLGVELARTAGKNNVATFTTEKPVFARGTVSGVLK